MIKKSKLVSKAGFTHAGQPSGKSIGAGSSTTAPKSGGMAKGTGGSSNATMGNVGSGSRGTSLVGKAGFTHAGQPSGKSIGVGMGNGAAHMRKFVTGGAHSFKGMKCNPVSYGANGGDRVGSKKS